MAENNITEQNEELEYDVYVAEEQENISIEETVEVIEVSESESYTVESLDAFPAVGESNENLKHQLLNGRELADQHPITSITGLREELDNIEALQTVYSDEKQVADYYEWEDGNILQENRVGLFVSLCKDIKKIKVCDRGEIFGVVVDNAALVGGQDDIIRDYKYGLVTYSGVVHVRCESDVKAEDFVISNIYGIAKKSNNNYGCRVISLKEINGVAHAAISLGASINQIDSIGNELKILDNRMDDAEKNIASSINLANEAYKKAEEAGSISEEAIRNAIEAMDKADDAIGEVDKMNETISSANEVAVQAKAIADSALASAAAIREEAVEKAKEALDEASQLRDEFTAKATEMSTDLENAALELQAVKEDFEKTKDNMNIVVGDMKNTVNDTKSQIEDLSEEIQPIIEHENGAAGLVKQSDDDHILLGEIAAWKDGSGQDSFAGYIEEVGRGYATAEQFAIANGNIALVKTTADTNKATIDAITSFDVCDVVSITILDEVPTGTYYKQEPNWNSGDNKWIFGEWNQDLEQWYAYTESQTNVSDEFCYSEATNNTYYKYSYNSSTQKWNRATMGKTGASIAGVKSISDANKAQIDLLASWKSTIADENGELKLASSISGVEAKADKQGAYLASLASYDLCDVVKFEILSEKPSGTYYTKEPKWDSSISRWRFATYDEDVKNWIDYKDSNWSDYTEPEGGTDDNSYYGVSNTFNTYYQYTYKDSVWSRSELGRDSSSIAGVKSTADANKAELDAIADYDKDGKSVLAGMTAYVDENSAKLKELAKYENDKSGQKGVAGLVADVNANTSKLSVLAEHSFTKDDGTTYTGLAGLTSQVNDTTAETNLIASTVKGEYIEIPTKPSNDADMVKGTFYYEKKEGEDKGYYWYYNEDNSTWEVKPYWESLHGKLDKSKIYYVSGLGEYWWHNTREWKWSKNPYDAGLTGAIAGIKVSVNENSSEINDLVTWSGTAKDSMATIQRKADENGASINLMVSSIDKYSVGEYSQAYGLTYDQAKSILKPGMIYIPTEDHSEEYSNTIFIVEYYYEAQKDENVVYYTKDYDTYWYYEAGAWKSTQNKSTAEIYLKKSETDFTKGYYYEWGINDQDKVDWIEHSDGKVWIASYQPSNSANTYKYWYIDFNTAPDRYEPYALYIWDEVKGENDNTSMQWVKVNTLAGNVNNRITSMIRQTADEIALEVSNTRGSVAALNARVTDTESSVTSMASQMNSKYGVIDNVLENRDDRDTSQIYYKKIDGTHTYFYYEGTSWYSTDDWSVICGKLDTETVYYVPGIPEYWWCDDNEIWQYGETAADAGLKGTLAVIQQKADEDGASIAQVVSAVGDNGKVSAASIVQSINKQTGESAINLNADRINLEGAITANGTFSIDTSGYMKATGGTIGGWNITPNMLSTGNTDGSQTGTGFFINNGNRDSWIAAHAGNDNWPFYVTKSGQLVATGADIQGTITADDGIIGGWNIESDKLWHVDDGNIRGTGMAATSAEGSPAFWAGYTGKGNHPWEHSSKATDGTSWSDWTKFYVTNGGSLCAKSGTVGGWLIGPTTLMSKVYLNDEKTSYYSLSLFGDTLTKHPTQDRAADAMFIEVCENGKSSWPFAILKDGTINCKKLNASDDSTFSGKLSAAKGTFAGELSAATGTFKGTVSANAIIADGAQMGTYSSLGNWKFGGNTLYINSLWDEELSKTIYTAFTPNYLYCGKTSGSASYAHWENVVDAGQAYSGGSDLRIKKDIENLTNNYDNFFDLLQAKRYKYIDGTSDRYHTGFIAQEVVTALVDSGLDTQQFAGVMLKEPGTEDECWHLRRDEFVALNTWQIQKAKARITELEERVAELERLIKGE